VPFFLPTDAEVEQFILEEACVSEVREAERTEADLYMMLDSSSSMLETTGTGESKWDAVKSAITDFVDSPEAENVGIGLQYFPITVDDAPAECETDEACGAAAPCAFLGICSNETLVTSFGCLTDDDCSGESSCEPIGTCENEPLDLCPTIGASCGGDRGICEALPGSCLGRDSCSSEQYAEPAVPISRAAERLEALTSSLEGQEPSGLTPTAAALEGAIAHARAFAEEHPGHIVATVLATDGFPTLCEVQDTDGLVDIARAWLLDAPSVCTFVVGVFSDLDAFALEDLNRLARAGGTLEAFVVDDQRDVTQQFSQALDRARSTLGCEFDLPTTTDFDPERVNLRFDAGDGERIQLANVGDLGGCLLAPNRGWYYELDDDSDAPVRLRVCPGACAEFAKAPLGRVDLQIGCQTIVR
jgi:hypothetical protein